MLRRWVLTDLVGRVLWKVFNLDAETVTIKFRIGTETHFVSALSRSEGYLADGD